MTELNLQRPGLPGNTSQEKVIIGAAAVGSLLLHAVLLGVLQVIPWNPQLAEPRTPDTSADVEVILESWEPAGESEQPKTYVSVPDHQAVAEAPEDPDYLALHHSEAADNKLGDSARPSADEEGEFDMVQIRKEELTGADGVEYSQQPMPENKPATSRQESGSEGADEAEAAGDNQTSDGDWALPREDTKSGGEATGDKSDTETNENPDLENWWGGRSNPSILKQGDEGSVGDRGFDFNQPASGTVTSGVAVINDFALSTLDWDFAPWIQVFANELHRHWVSPYAYRLGLINGTTTIRLVVERDGRPSHIEVVDEKGHESLHTASTSALKAFAPYSPLPDDFPDENLVITLSLHYPAFRR